MATPGHFGCTLPGTQGFTTLKSARGCSKKSTGSGFDDRLEQEIATTPVVRRGHPL